jgi:hypothetical protein
MADAMTVVVRPIFVVLALLLRFTNVHSNPPLLHTPVFDAALGLYRLTPLPDLPLYRPMPLPDPPLYRPTPQSPLLDPQLNLGTVCLALVS